MRINSVLIIIVLVLGVESLFSSFQSLVRRIRESELSIQEIINSNRPLSQAEIKFFVLKFKIRGLSLNEVRENFLIFKNNNIYLDDEKINEFVNNPEFNMLEISYPFSHIGSSPVSFREFMYNLRNSARWQLIEPETFNEEEFGKLALIIAVSGNIFYASGRRRNFLLPDPLNSQAEDRIKPFILGNIFTGGIKRVDGEYEGSYFRIVDDLKGNLIVEFESKDLSKSKIYIGKIYVKEAGRWFRWNLRDLTYEDIFYNTGLVEFLDNLVESNPYRKY